MHTDSISRSGQVRPIAISVMLFSLALVAGISILSKGQQDAASAVVSNERFGVAEAAFRITSDDIDEGSGIIPSIRYEGCFWTHNDSGAKEGLFLIGSDGKHLATVQIKKAKERDWESIAIVRRGDRNLIAVADIGDNLAQHPSCQIYLIEEPELKLDREPDKPVNDSVSLVQTISFRYPDGPQDCEAMAFDAAGQRFWFVSKQRPGGPGTNIAGGKNGALAETAFHFLELPSEDSDSDEVITATRIETRFKELFVTGMDISLDDRVAIIRTPLQIFLFDRAEDQSWSNAFSGVASASTVIPLQIQGEAVCFSADGGAVWLTSEGVNQPAWRIPLKAGTDQ